MAGLGLASALPIASVLSRLATLVGEMETRQLPWGFCWSGATQDDVEASYAPRAADLAGPPPLGFPGCGVSEAAKR